MKIRTTGGLASVVYLFGITLAGTTAQAAVITIGPSAFPAGSLLVDFAGAPDGANVNGLTVNGVAFSYTVGGIPLNGAVIIDGGPGVTNNIAPLNIVSVGNNTGTLTMTLPAFASHFGYGYAILSGGSVANATTITLFNGMTNVGSLSYNGVPDPTFTGGFAGIESTILFNRVAVTFNSAAAPAFALDNIRVGLIPEPSTTILFLSGAIAAVFYRRLSKMVSQ